MLLIDDVAVVVDDGSCCSCCCYPPPDLDGGDPGDADVVVVVFASAALPKMLRLGGAQCDCVSTIADVCDGFGGFMYGVAGWRW